MYTIVWCEYDHKIHATTTGTALDAWEIYWILSRYLKASRTVEQCWLSVYRNGTPLDPTQGGELPIREGSARILPSEW